MSALVTRPRMVAGQKRRRAAHNRMVLASTVLHGGAGLTAGSGRVIAGGAAEDRGASAGGPGPGPGPGRPAAAACRSFLPSWPDRGAAVAMSRACAYGRTPLTR